MPIPPVIDAHPVQTAQTIPVIDPATGEQTDDLCVASADDVARAVDAAASAFPAWSAMPAVERSRRLFRLADLITENLEPLARAESHDTGKPVSLAQTVDIPRAAANFRYFAGAILHAPGDLHDMPPDAINLTLRKPRGVCALISPWNLPLYLLTWKIAPAIATGNTCVCKPSELTPTTAHLLMELVARADIPPGVVNMLQGPADPTGQAMVTHPQVPTISFTGSTRAGRWIAQHAGRDLKRVSLELGGKNPALVFDDADIEHALATCMRAAFTNQGQICLCASRLLVHQHIYDRFLERFCAAARDLRPGDPQDPDTRMGALVSHEHRDRVDGFVRRAREQGARVLVGGRPAEPPNSRCARGAFYEPTVITDADPACEIEQEEVFGPVVTVSPFDDEDEAVARANGTRYGLAATVFTNDLSRAHRLARRLDAGIVWINCWMVRDLRTPFGGMKQSGVGREGGLEAIRFFTEPTNVCIQIQEHRP